MQGVEEFVHMQASGSLTDLVSPCVVQLLQDGAADTEEPWLDQAWSTAAHEQPIAAFLTSVKVGYSAFTLHNPLMPAGTHDTWPAHFSCIWTVLPAAGVTAVGCQGQDG